MEPPPYYHNTRPTVFIPAEENRYDDNGSPLTYRNIPTTPPLQRNNREIPPTPIFPTQRTCRTPTCDTYTDRKCQYCFFTYYCSEQHELNDLKEHRMFCQEMQNTIAKTAYKKTLCSVCGIVSAKFMCGNCENVLYCSPQCQNSGWSVHQSLCRTKEEESKQSQKSIPELIYPTKWGCSGVACHVLTARRCQKCAFTFFCSEKCEKSVAKSHTQMCAHIYKNKEEKAYKNVVCNACKIGKSILMCPQCNSRVFCSLECQISDWKTHRKMCPLSLDEKLPTRSERDTGDTKERDVGNVSKQTPSQPWHQGYKQQTPKEIGTKPFAQTKEPSNIPVKKFIAEPVSAPAPVKPLTLLKRLVKKSSQGNFLKSKHEPPPMIKGRSVSEPSNSSKWATWQARRTKQKKTKTHVNQVFNNDKT